MTDFDAAKHGAGTSRTPEENRVALIATVAEATARGGGVVHLPAGIYATPVSHGPTVSLRACP